MTQIGPDLDSFWTFCEQPKWSYQMGLIEKEISKGIRIWIIWVSSLDHAMAPSYLPFDALFGKPFSKFSRLVQIWTFSEQSKWNYQMGLV